MGEANSPQAAIPLQDWLLPGETEALAFGAGAWGQQSHGGQAEGSPCPLSLGDVLAGLLGHHPQTAAPWGTAPTPTAHTYFIW